MKLNLKLSNNILQAQNIYPEFYLDQYNNHLKITFRLKSF